MKGKGVFLATTSLAIQDEGCADVARTTISATEWDAFRLLGRAGYTIVLLTPERTAVYAEPQIGQRGGHVGLQMTLASTYRRRDLNNRSAPLFQATAALDIDLEQSWTVSDRLDTIEVGRMVGCKTVFLTNGSETGWEMTAMRWPDLIAGDMWEIACLIVLSDGAYVERLTEEHDSDE